MSKKIPRHIDVAVPLPLRSPLTYRLGEGLSGSAEPGARAVVPVGSRFLTGVIVGKVDKPALDPARVKEVRELPDAEPATSSVTISPAEPDETAGSPQPLVDDSGDKTPAPPVARPVNLSAADTGTDSLADLSPLAGFLVSNRDGRFSVLVRDLQTGPNTLWAYTGAQYLAEAYAHQGKFEKSIRIYKNMQRVDSTPLYFKAQAQLLPNMAIPSRAISFKDIAAAVSAFVGTAYADLDGITGPCACPSIGRHCPITSGSTRVWRSGGGLK